MEHQIITLILAVLICYGQAAVKTSLMKSLSRYMLEWQMGDEELKEAGKYDCQET